MMTYSRVEIVFILSLVACVALVVSGGFSQSSTNPIVTTNTLHTQTASGGGQTHATQGASVANTLTVPSGTMPASHEQPAVMCPLITAIKIGNRPAPPCPPLPMVPLSPCPSDEITPALACPPLEKTRAHPGSAPGSLRHPEMHLQRSHNPPVDTQESPGFVGEMLEAIDAPGDQRAPVPV